jgi:hypothetical protein
VAETFPTDSAEPLSEVELHSFIAQHLPAWQQACDADDGDSIVLHETSFGTSTYELFLFACAIKYAAAKGKDVHVTSGSGMKNSGLETVPSIVIKTVFRDVIPGKGHAPTRSSSSKKPTRKR